MLQRGGQLRSAASVQMTHEDDANFAARSSARKMTDDEASEASTAARARSPPARTRSWPPAGLSAGGGGQALSPSGLPSGGGGQGQAPTATVEAASSLVMPCTRLRGASEALAPAPAEAKPHEYTVVLRLQSKEQDLGINVDASDRRVLTVTKVKEGPVADWNAEQDEQRQVMAMDRIVSVNDVRGNSGMLLEAILIRDAPQQELELVMWRHVEFSVELRKTGIGSKKLGIVVVPNSGTHLMVAKVKPGMVDDWNRAQPEKKVCFGDRIVSVNGLKADEDALLEAVQKADVLKIVLRRGASARAVTLLDSGKWKDIGLKRSLRSSEDTKQSF